MQIFKLNREWQVVCVAESTRSGFRHVASLCSLGRSLDTAKCCYINRTWESYTYQSVLQKLIGGTTYLTDKEKKRFLKKVKLSKF